MGGGGWNIYINDSAVEKEIKYSKWEGKKYNEKSKWNEVK